MKPLLNTESTYKTLQSFNTVIELNVTVKYYKQQSKSQITKSTYAVLDFISSWACKYIGVCSSSKSKMAQELGISRRTVIRACEILESLGIIVQYETKRASGDRRRSTNAIVIQPSKQCHNQMSQQDTPLNTLNINNTDDTVNTDFGTKNVDKENLKQQKAELIKKGLVIKLPQPLQFLSAFFNHDDLHKVVGTIFKAKSKVSKDIRIEDHEQEYRESILSVLNAYKRGKAKSLHGLLFSSIRNVTLSISLKSRLFDAFGI